MMSIGLAKQLRDLGLRWSPAAGDRFVVADRDMDEHVLVIAEMVIEVDEVPTGRLIRFNGTTEWALDSIREEDAVWLPRESPSRESLGDHFQSLARVDGGFRVRTTVNGVDRAVEHPDAEQAFGLALLDVLAG